MLLETKDAGCFIVQGAVTFDNAAQVAEEGKKVLARAFTNNPKDAWFISLAEMALSDSSALSVFLSWVRFAQSKNTRLCFTNMPAQFEALAKVSDVY
ncbi:MAG: STAS domain-containing protein, partial [Endozoicomonas sp. (ex Botrylloides leachii)]|nr:STAS domain-containing protein [Endozoicomonas sp. (ex Botrylloides leachii)]